MFQGQDTKGLFEASELEALECDLAEGVTSQLVLSLFQERGIKLSEATFRKYVQLGLLPTSRRVGSKGKHRGSRGIYPASIVRRINLIKSLMAEGLTLEEIGDSFLAIQNDIERVHDAFESLFSRMDDRLYRLEGEGQALRPIERDLAATRKGAKTLIKQIERIGSRLAVAGPASAGQE